MSAVSLKFSQLPTTAARVRRVLPGIGMSTPYRSAMRELRLVKAVGGGADREHVVVEVVDGGEQFRLRIDDLRRHLDQLDSAESAPEPVNVIPPREIQMRVRAGEAPGVLADEAGVSIDRVLLFAGPVLDERSRMADEARRARARRSTPDGQLVTFGEAVDERFGAHGIDPASVRWDSHRRDDGQWIVSAGWRGGESERTAEWSFSLASRAVTPLDETASDLLSDRPIRPVVAAVPDLPAAPHTSAPDALTGPLPLMVDRPAAGDEELFDEGDDAADGVPPLPLHLVDQAKARAAHPNGRGAKTAKTAKAGEAAPAEPPARPSHENETDEQKAARARIPSWDDILLGVRRKRD
jgi:DUF3071 family protein